MAKMKTLTFWLSGILAVYSTCVTASDNMLTETEEQSGWSLLFNGSDLQQWRTFKKEQVSPGWVIENNAITLKDGGAGDLITRQRYSNFDLKLDWKIAEGGNSGIFILADETGKTIYAHAPEIQILDNERHSDNKLDTHRSGSLYDMVAAHPSAYKKAGEWNQVRIRLNDGLLQVWQNEVMTTNVVIGSSTWDVLVQGSKFADWQGFGDVTNGHIGLQDHGDKVWFKNIRIKEL